VKSRYVKPVPEGRTAPALDQGGRKRRGSSDERSGVKKKKKRRGETHKDCKGMLPKPGKWSSIWVQNYGVLPGRKKRGHQPPQGFLEIVSESNRLWGGALIIGVQQTELTHKTPWGM